LLTGVEACNSWRRGADSAHWHGGEEASRPRSGQAGDNNGTYGFRIDDSPPIATIADLTAAGNVASGNGTPDFRVD
jgi:hypothetical protein